MKGKIKKTGTMERLSKTQGTFRTRKDLWHHFHHTIK